jgi:hypothetical protein
MCRLIVQSLATGCFLVPGAHTEVTWERALSDAGGGIVPDMQFAVQLLRDHCDLDDEAVIVDLDAVLVGT